MLSRKDTTAGNRIAAILLRMAIVTGTVLGSAYAASRCGLGEWPPPPAGPLGLTAGILVGLIVFFEMLLTPRKWLRGFRLLSAQFYMRWHIRLGFLSLPLVLLHSGFGLGGALPATVLLLFLAVFASGVWGLVLQQWLPSMLLNDVPDETIEADGAVRTHRQVLEAGRLIESMLSALPPPAVASRPLTGGAGDALIGFRDAILLPFFRGRTHSPLRDRARADNLFVSLEKALPVTSLPAIARLKRMVAVRRQWNLQARIHFWLNNWLLVHLPLSVAMTMLMVLHAVRALKYW